MIDLGNSPPGGTASVEVTFVSPGGIAVKPFADGYLTMRVCLGHIHHAEDGLLAELSSSRPPVPWASATVRNEAIEELKRRARAAEGDGRDVLIRLLEKVHRTPYYEDT